MWSLIIEVGDGGFFFFFWRIFATWRQNKMAGESNKGISEIFFKNQFGEFSQPGDKKKGWRIQQRDF
jgi:hypothetical protein